MNHYNERFTPENVEAQIDYHLTSPEQPDNANAHMLHDLQYLTQNDTMRLAKIKERLAEYSTGTHAKREPIQIHECLAAYHTSNHNQLNTTTSDPILPPREQARRRSRTQLFIKVASGLAAMLVITSMLTIFALARLPQQHKQNKQPPASSTIIAAPTIHGSAALLIDMTTGKPIREYNSHLRVPMGNFVNIMTILATINNTDLQQSTFIQQSELASVPIEMRTAQLQVGDRLSLQDLLYGVFLPSGADAATTIAYKVGGSPEHFVAMMNEEARQLQLADTHFSSPYASSSQDQHTSTADLAKLTRHALQYFLFERIIATQTYPLPATSDHHNYSWQSNNLLHSDNPDLRIIATNRTGPNYSSIFLFKHGNQLQLGVVLNVPKTDILMADIKNLLNTSR